MAAKQKKIDAINPPYEVIQELGSGAMGDVLLCRDPYLDRPFAVKRLRMELLNSREALGRFSREVHILSQLRHPNIAHVYGYWETEGVRYVSMEFVAGWSLKKFLEQNLEGKKRKPFPEWAVLSILWDILSALAYAHADYAHKGLGRIVHRDIKPANIMVGYNGRITLLDFGISKPRYGEESQYRTENMEGSIGTIAYMSPEQISPQNYVQDGYPDQAVTPASDIFSLGILLCEMLTAKHPVLGPNAIATCHNIVHKPVTAKDLQGVDPFLRTCILRMVDRDPSKRPSAEALKRMLAPMYQKYPRDLSPYLGNLLLHLRKPQEVLPPPTPQAEFRPRLPIKWLAMAISAGALIGFLVGRFA